MLETFYFSPAAVSTDQVIAVLPPKSDIKIDDSIRALISDSDTLINGRKVETLGNLATDTVRNGLNWIESKGHVWRAWYEEKQLKPFEDPYKNSFAIVAAINKYGAVEQGGFNKLNLMVENAQELVEKLVALGFPRSNIITLFDDKATSVNIENALKEFWDGGPFENADRLVVYFGGHGARINLRPGIETRRERGVLITSDYRPGQPSRTGLVLDDIMTRHFMNVAAHHVLALIDACSSGLALPAYQGNAEDEKAAKEFKRLAVALGDSAAGTRYFGRWYKQ